MNQLVIATLPMQNHNLEYIKRNTPGSGAAVLLIGPQAASELRKLYSTLSELEYKRLIEVNEEEVQFWTDFLGHIKRESPLESGLERKVAISLVETSLKNLGKPYHLFLPEVDKMFYKYDFQNKGTMGASLRRIWSTARINLTLFGSISNEDSRSYRTTIGRYEYPFWICNWLPIRL